MFGESAHLPVCSPSGTTLSYSTLQSSLTPVLLQMIVRRERGPSVAPNCRNANKREGRPYLGAPRAPEYEPPRRAQVKKGKSIVTISLPNPCGRPVVVQ